MMTVTDAEKAFYESRMAGLLDGEPYTISDLRLAYFLAALDGALPGGGGGGGAVDSVNGKTGVVVLAASDVGAAGAGGGLTGVTVWDAVEDITSPVTGGIYFVKRA